jgi:hypothetical protein
VCLCGVGGGGGEVLYLETVFISKMDTQRFATHMIHTKPSFDLLFTT